MCKRFEHTFFQRGHTSRPQMYEYMLYITIDQGNVNQNHNDITSYLLGQDIHHQDNKNPNKNNIKENKKQKNREYQVLARMYTVSETIKYCSYEKQYGASSKT